MLKITLKGKKNATHIVSGWGQPYNIWLPIFINHDHLKRSKDSIIKSLKILSLDDDCNSKVINPGKALNLLCGILNKLVVNLLKVL